LVTSTSKAIKELQWKPKYSVLDMIKSDYLFRKKLNMLGNKVI
jgi:UDP-glucose 4-epimerase